MTATGEGTLTYQWFKVETLLPGETDTTLTIPNAQFDDAGLYSVAVTDDNGTTVSEAVGLAVNELQPGDLDLSFNVGSSINGRINSIAVQPDGKVLIGGEFTQVSGVTRNRIARMNSDGSLDTTFLNGSAGANNHVVSVAVDSNEKILIGGWFTAVNGVTRNFIARLNSDGSLDTGFQNGLTGANSNVLAIAVQSEGKVLIGGDFLFVNGVARNRIARLHSDGSVDTSFLNALTGVKGTVETVAVQNDGKVLIGGQFGEVNGVTRNRIARLNSDGSLDTGFQNGMTGANNTIRGITVQLDGKILTGGYFTAVNGVTRNRIARLNSDGSLDATFLDSLAGANGLVDSLVVALDEKIFIGGSFTEVNGMTRNRIARLNSDGSLDATFLDGLAGANSRVWSVALGADKKILIGGDFTIVNGLPADKLAALFTGATVPVDLPLLSIGQPTPGGDEFLLTWEGDGFILEATTSLTDPNWVSVPHQTGSPNTATDTTSATAKFYRLRK